MAILNAVPDDDPDTAQLVRAWAHDRLLSNREPWDALPPSRGPRPRVDDLMVALALYRPGPLTGGLKMPSWRRFRGQEPQPTCTRP